MDLIVVGTSEALTMVEAGADEVPGDIYPRGVRAAHAEIRRICEALKDLREQVGKPKWVDTELTVELEAEHGEAGAAIAGHGLREAVVVDEFVAGASPEISMASTEDDMVRRACVKASFAAILERARLSAVEGPIREQFLDLRELTDAEQDSKELRLGEARPALRLDPRGARASVPDGAAARRGRACREGLRDEAVRQACVRGRVRPSSARRSRSTSAGRTVAPRRRSATSSATSP